MEPVDVSYMNWMYSQTDDPWHIRDSWYERRKRAVVLASLPHQRYARGFEPGCSNGAVTELLADRCDLLVSADMHQRAVDATRAATAGRGNVDVRRLFLPAEFPAETFDLVVLSEIGYFFTPSAWKDLVTATTESLVPPAVVLACHWLHPFAERTAGTDSIHGAVDSAGLDRQVVHRDADFELVVWSR